MATPAWENPGQPSEAQKLEVRFKSLWDSLQKSKESWKRQQRLSLFDSCELGKADQRIADAQQVTAFRQLQATYEKVETEIVKWRQHVVMQSDNILYSKCQEFLLSLLNNSCICSKQPPPIVDGDSKRSRPQVEIRILTGKISNMLQDGQMEIAMALLTDEQARNAISGKGLPEKSDFVIDWHGKGPVPLMWDSANRWFKTRFTDLVLKKPGGQKWLDGYQLYFYNAAPITIPGSQQNQVSISCLSTPFEVVSNRTGQKPHKMRNEFWRLAFCTNDSDSSTVGLKSIVPGDSFLDFFDRWFRGLTGSKTGLNEEHKRSIAQMLKMKENMVTWERFKKNWSSLYHSTEYIKTNQFLWNTGILKHCFATREETEKLLAQYHEKVMLIRFQQTAPGYLSISFILPGETPEDGRYMAHCPLESYFKRNYTLVQCIEYADLLWPNGKRIKAKLRDFKILGANEKFEYREILEEDERTREQVYAMIQNRQAIEAGEQGGNEKGPMIDYSTVKERFKIKVTKVPESDFAASTSPPRFISASPSFTSTESPSPTSIADSSPRSSIASVFMPDYSMATDQRQQAYNGTSVSSGASGVPFIQNLNQGTMKRPHCSYEDQSTNGGNGGNWRQPNEYPFLASSDFNYTPNPNEFTHNQTAPESIGMIRHGSDPNQQANSFSDLQWQAPVVPQQQLDTPTADCTVVFDYRQENLNRYGGNSTLHNDSTAYNYQTAPVHAPNYSPILQSPDYQNEYLDQSIVDSDPDLSTLLAAFSSFNNVPEENHFASAGGKRVCNGATNQQMVIDCQMQKRNEINQGVDMGFDMTADFLVPNR